MPDREPTAELCPTDPAALRYLISEVRLLSESLSGSPLESERDEAGAWSSLALRAEQELNYLESARESAPAGVLANQSAAVHRNSVDCECQKCQRERVAIEDEIQDELDRRAEREFGIE